jgi:hypothetical protein
VDFFDGRMLTTLDNIRAARKLTFEYMAGRAARQQTTETLQELYDGKLRLERRNGGSKIPPWQLRLPIVHGET